MADEVRVVYRCKTLEEARRRVARAEALIGKPFLRLPGNRDQKTVLFISRQNQAVTVEMVEQVYNDMLLMDAISDQGKDGPLTRETYGDDSQGRLMREVLDYAIEAYEGAKWLA
jgi:hypothetical protein